ncbi:unnamed protein product [marine sediment metagenome]|uniref:Uncharacterized protein n=1 Tax=marine sediment metagenome TaxID=412755 RepID=X1NHD9_9ZZZZ
MLVLGRAEMLADMIMPIFANFIRKPFAVTIGAEARFLAATMVEIAAL